MARLDKRETFLALMEKGWVSLCLDARADGVELPGHLRGEPRLVLQYGLNMPVPITDLDVGEEGVRATLSFDRTPHCTFVPWSAVYIIMPTDADQPGVLYAEDIPPELQASLRFQMQSQGRGGDAEGTGGQERGKRRSRGARAAGAPAPGTQTGARAGDAPRGAVGAAFARRTAKPRPTLGLVPPEATPPAGADGTRAPDGAQPDERKRRPRKPTLRLVK